MKIDYFTMTPPWPDTTGANLRVNAIYDSLLRHDYDVRLVVLGEKPDRTTRRRLDQVGARVYSNWSDALPAKVARYLFGAVIGRDPVASPFLHHWGLEHFGRLVVERQPDAILLGSVYLAPLIPILQNLLPNLPIILDNHNVESLLHERMRAQGETLRVRLPAGVVARASRHLEREYLCRATQVWACSEVDAGYFRCTYGVPKVHILPNVVDTQAFDCSSASEARAIVFTGTLWYPPNDQAARRLIQISRRLSRQGLEHRLYLVGQGPKAALVNEARRGPNVVVTGAVPDVRPYLGRASVFAAPLRAGSGTKLKLLQAMSMGKAIVTTTIGAEGLRLTDGVDAIVTDDDAGFERHLVRLLQSPDERARLGAAARSHVVEQFSLEAFRCTIGETLRELFRPAVGQAPMSAPTRGASSTGEQRPQGKSQE